MLGRIGQAAVTEVGALQPGRRGDEVNVILIICLEIGIPEGHVEHVRRSDDEFHIDALDVSLRGVGREGRGRNSREQNERSEEHTSELQSLMRISYAVFCLKKKKIKKKMT